ncbi:hypothetical protein AB0E55_11230 [Amycolatopsis keratiniphila]|uniref:hypothetical protein n=1 Tax=Amycolatopsis keratiniphila TaxID=129921 RepID=UPI0033E5B5D4
MVEGEYGSAEIEVLKFDESVRRRPAMYFSVSLDDPRLSTNVVRAADHAIHPAPHLAEPHSLVVDVEILGDLSFSITDDQLCRAGGCQVPRSGYFGSLLGPDRWTLAAAAALSRRTTVTVRRDGCGLRQELAGLRRCRRRASARLPSVPSRAVSRDLRISSPRLWPRSVM